MENCGVGTLITFGMVVHHFLTQSVETGSVDTEDDPFPSEPQAIHPSSGDFLHSNQTDTESTPQNSDSSTEQTIKP